jgi:hypothetical protein
MCLKTTLVPAESGSPVYKARTVENIEFSA